MRDIETIIVGGGQAGLATSYCLNAAGMEHIVLEQGDRPAPVWSNGRWDSFTLVTPNQAFTMPGAEYRGNEPGGFMPKAEVCRIFDRYASDNRLPLLLNTRVTRVGEAERRRYHVETSAGDYRAHNVVIATGFEQSPNIPEAVHNTPSNLVQLHSSQYRNPDSLPDGAVLVVGSAQSGAQIAEELYLAGRKVYLSVGSAGRVPRRYRGRDVFLWLLDIGFFDMPKEQFPMPIERFSPPHVTGVKGGHTLNLHQFSRDGVTLVGHIRGITDDVALFAPDLHELLARADGFETEFLKMVDGFIQKRGLDCPPEEVPQLRDGFQQPVMEKLDLTANGISTVIWATGYQHNYGFVDLPVFDARGFPVQEQGATRLPGLSFAGMPWMPGLRTGTLAGVGEVARRTAERIAAPVMA